MDAKLTWEEQEKLEELQERKLRRKQAREINKFEKDLLYVWTSIPGMKTCQNRGYPAHMKGSKQKTTIIVHLGKEIAFFCQYCFWGWLGECIKDLKKAKIKFELPPPKEHYQNYAGWLDFILLSQHSQKRPCQCFKWRGMHSEKNPMRPNDWREFQRIEKEIQQQRKK